MKRFVVFVLALMLALSPMMALAEAFVDQIANARTAQAFTDEPMDEADLSAIVQAGLAATSAMNSQPWFFAVVTDETVMSELSQGGAPPAVMRSPEAAEGGQLSAPPAGGDQPATVPAAPQGSARATKAGVGSSPVAIVIYCDPNSRSTSAEFDCGLATQNMFNAAVALGYGAKIVSSPTITLNGDRHDELCEKLGVDTSLQAVAVLLIGHTDPDIDAITTVTTRQSAEEKVSFIGG